MCGIMSSRPSWHISFVLIPVLSFWTPSKIFRKLQSTTPIGKTTSEKAQNERINYLCHNYSIWGIWNIKSWNVSVCMMFFFLLHDHMLPFTVNFSGSHIYYWVTYSDFTSLTLCRTKTVGHLILCWLWCKISFIYITPRNQIGLTQ